MTVSDPDSRPLCNNDNRWRAHVVWEMDCSISPCKGLKMNRWILHERERERGIGI